MRPPIIKVESGSDRLSWPTDAIANEELYLTFVKQSQRRNNQSIPANMLPDMRTQYHLLDFRWHVIFQRQLQPTIPTTIHILATPRSRTTMRTHNPEPRQFMNRDRRQYNSFTCTHPLIATKPVVGTLMSGIMTMTALFTNIRRHNL